MARLLLRSRRMRLWALLPLVASSGCLFLDGLNHPPTVGIADGITSTIKGSMLTIHAVADDLEDGSAGVRFTFSVTAADGQALAQPCDYDSYASGSNFNVTFYRTGIFDVEAVGTDSRGATGSSHVMLTISDAKPKFDPTAIVKQTSTKDACDLNAAGSAITLGLTDGSVSDDDSGTHSSAPGCAPTEWLTYTWRISDWPAGSKPVLTAFDGMGCAAPTADSGPTLQVQNGKAQVCLWTDPMVAGATAMYSVVLEVSDGSNVVTSPAGNVAVVPDQDPCITGSNPLAGSYVVDRTQLQQFEIDGAVDDRDLFGNGGITFVWSVYRASDGTWRDVPDWSLSTYQLDVSSFGVGEKLSVRAEALDRRGIGARVSPMVCPVANDDCVVSSCASSPNACHKWKTWNLELR